MSAENNIVFPVLPVAGLGHCLRIYGKAFTYFADGLADFVHPSWLDLNRSTYHLRYPSWEMASRQYHRDFMRRPKWGSNESPLAARLKRRTVSESTFDPDESDQFLVVNDSAELDYNSLARHKDFFVASLKVSLKKEAHWDIVRRSDYGAGPKIAIFHREGDFVQDQFNGAFAVDHQAALDIPYGYVPLDFSISALRTIRDLVGWQVPAVVASEGDDSSLARLFDEGSVTRVQTKTAIGTLLALSSFDVIIWGKSNFGRWSYFLGSSFGIFPPSGELESVPNNEEGRAGTWYLSKEENGFLSGSKAADIRQILAKSRGRSEPF